MKKFCRLFNVLLYVNFTPMGSFKKTLYGYSAMTAIFAVIGCMSPPSIAATPPMQQFIIKFRPGGIECNTAGIAHLSSVTKVPLEFIRSMSGDACVIRQLTRVQNDLLLNQERLRQNSAVEWLELDAKKKAW